MLKNVKGADKAFRKQTFESSGITPAQCDAGFILGSKPFHLGVTFEP
jgi:hypothetical protein